MHVRVEWFMAPIDQFSVQSPSRWTASTHKVKGYKMETNEISKPRSKTVKHFFGYTFALVSLLLLLAGGAGFINMHDLSLVYLAETFSDPDLLIAFFAGLLGLFLPSLITGYIAYRLLGSAHRKDVEK
jgi:hypothetical protein